MRWGLNHGQTGSLDQGDAQGPVRHLYLYVASDLHAHVEKAATTAGLKTASWLRHMVRRITLTDFPPSWQAERPAERSHDSRVYGTRFMLRLDDQTKAKLEVLCTQFGTSAAEVIRQLVAQATPDTCPASWHRRVAEHYGERVRSVPHEGDQTGER
jgi:hypothetical protein